MVINKIFKFFRKDVAGVTRVSWVEDEKKALGRAMASFPPTVRGVMAEVLRPLDTFKLVNIEEG